MFGRSISAAAAIPDEALPEPRVRREIVGERLQGHLSSEPDVLDEIDEVAPAPSDDPLDAVARNLGAQPRIRDHVVSVPPP